MHQNTIKPTNIEVEKINYVESADFALITNYVELTSINKDVKSHHKTQA